MGEPNDPFFGNRPEDIWDEGYDAALAGRSRDTNPFRTGEAELLDRLGRENAGTGVTGTVTQVTPTEMAEIRRRQREREINQQEPD